jgi:uncharacterized protein (TIGR03545 family)
MTTSTDSTKKIKNKGPLRVEAVVPIAIIFALSFAYFRFFFDSNMRQAIEWTGTYVHGAEVNLGSFRTSFLDGTLQMKDLQVTNKTNPKLNLVQIGEIRFAFLWDALLRAKFVVPDAGIEGIQIFSPRKKPGYVKPPEPPSNEPSALAQLEGQVLDQTQKKFSGNVLGDIAALLESGDEKDVLKNIQSQLKAETTIRALQDELKVKEKAWKDRLEKFPRKEEFEELTKRAKALKFDTKDPKQFAADLKEVGKITKEADAKIDEIKNTSSALKSDIDKFNNEFRQLDDLVKQDIKDIEARLNIPDLDMKDLSQSLFGGMFAQNLVSVRKYMELGRKYMPPKKDPTAKAEQELIPPPRGKGKNIPFPITTSYPLFWLKKATISSEPTADGLVGKVAGELTHVTTSPSAIGQPATLQVAGDFPKVEVFGASLKLVVDHVAAPRETLDVTVDRFAVAEKSLIQDDNLALGIRRAGGSSRFNAALTGDAFSVELKTLFQDIEYDTKAKSKAVQEAVTTILAGIPQVTLNGGARGTWSDFDTSLNSNLGQELSSGLKKYVQAKVDEMKRKVREFVDIRVKGEKDKLKGDYDKLKNQFDSQIQSKKAEVDKAKADMKSQSDSRTSGAKDDAKKDLKERGKKLLKGLKF